MTIISESASRLMIPRHGSRDKLKSQWQQAWSESESTGPAPLLTVTELAGGSRRPGSRWVGRGPPPGAAAAVAAAFRWHLKLAAAPPGRFLRARRGGGIMMRH